MSFDTTIPPTQLSPEDRFKRLEKRVDELRGQVEGTADGSPLSIQSNKQFGLFGGSQRSLIFDSGFERNRSSWVLGDGMRYLQDSTLARSGHYCLTCRTAAENEIAIANQEFPVDAVPGNVLVMAGWARMSSGGGPSTAQVLLGTYDRDDVQIAATASAAVSLTTSYQLLLLTLVLPAGTTYLRFGIRCPQLDAGEVYFDDVVAFFLGSQDQHSEAAGPVTFAGTETVLGTVSIDAAQNTGFFPVIVQALVSITPGDAADVYQLQIRRDNASGAVLAGSPTGGLTHGIHVIRSPVMGFDSNPNTVTQPYVVTGQRLSGSGTLSATGITMLCSLRNIAL
jgi:hypothetical protein